MVKWDTLSNLIHGEVGHFEQQNTLWDGAHWVLLIRRTEVPELFTELISTSVGHDMFIITIWNIKCGRTTPSNKGSKGME